MAEKKKLDAKKIKEEFDALDDDEKSSILEALGIEKDDDKAGAIKNIIERLTKLETGQKKETSKTDGFFASFFK